MNVNLAKQGRSRDCIGKEGISIFYLLYEEPTPPLQPEDERSCSHDDSAMKMETKRDHDSSTTFVVSTLQAELEAQNRIEKLEKERRARDELAKEIEERKFEAQKRESMKTIKEVDEEREMLHEADAWREERVLMKLDDAKLFFENKCSQLKKLTT
ncbi:hypothetical protein Sjap_004891 [Stephania japonica]|uniref:Uncharacterized protein n=1 Tax=Stephania japonica TaxID=461633 RepID=A0AAP0K334_9MAGN